MTMYRVGEIVWAKIKGFPFWPATVQSPADAGGLKIPKKKNLYYVKFVDAADKTQFAWVAGEDMLDFAPNLQAQRAASENKGGKTYTDLKKCITIGMEAHKNYLEALAKNPQLAGEYGLAPNDAEPASASKAKPAKAEKSAKKTAPAISEPEPGTSSATKRIRIKAMPERSEEEKVQSSPKRSVPARKSAQKRMAIGDEDTPVKVNGQGSAKKLKIPIMTASAKKDIAAIKAETTVKEKSLANGKSTGDEHSLKRAREVSLGLMGLEDSRTVHVARQLLKKGVSVRVWAKDQLSKDLEYSNAERVNDGEKLFEEADVVLLSAAGNHELQALLGGVDHTLRKIRPAGKNKFKGVCVFSTLTKHESEELARKLEPKNILYLECAWIGSTEHAVVNQLSLVACGNKRLFEHCKPLFEAACGKCTFLSEELGRAQIVKAAVEIADGVALAGLVEAAYFAQQNGVDLDGLLPFWEQIGYGNSITVAKVRQIVDFGNQSKDSTASVFKEQYRSLRDAVSLAHPTSGPSSVTHLGSMVMDTYKTQFVTYRYEREQDRPFEEKIEVVKANEAASGSQRGIEIVETIPVADADKQIVVHDVDKELSHVGLTPKINGSSLTLPHSLPTNSLQAGLGKVTEAAKTTTQVKNTNGMEVDDDDDEDEQEADEAGSGSENDDAGDAVADSSAEGDQLVIA